MTTLAQPTRITIDYTEGTATHRFTLNRQPKDSGKLVEQLLNVIGCQPNQCSYEPQADGSCVITTAIEYIDDNDGLRVVFQVLGCIADALGAHDGNVVRVVLATGEDETPLPPMPLFDVFAFGAASLA